MEYLFICLSSWTTCRKARAWLDDKGIDYKERPIKSENPREEELKEWINRSDYPLKDFFNARGKVYRELNLKEKLPEMSQDEAIKILATDGMLIKRPLLIGKDTVLVGFKKKEWEEKLT